MLKKQPSGMPKSKKNYQKKIATKINMYSYEFFIYEAKITFSTFLEDVLSGKNVRKISETPRVLIFEVVADHQYHSSRSKWGCWNFPNFQNPSNFKHL